MSIKIRKTATGEVFDLPVDYVVEGVKNNPLFEDKGSQTIPIAFPASVRNNRMLNFPFRLDKAFRQEETNEVFVETGAVQQRGLLSVNSASKKVISANIGYDKSEMYVQMGNMQLKDIPDLPVKSFGGGTVDSRIKTMLTHLTYVMKGLTENEGYKEDYAVFPVVLKKEEVESGVTYEILNDVDITVTNTGGIAELKALENRTIVRYENGEEIELSAPKGYGVSAFLKVWRVLELVFDFHFGFKIEANPFREHQQLQKLVVLNNTMDAILDGRLYYKDLMPDVTIKEFLDSLYSKFGMLYFIDSNSKTVRLKFLKDLINYKHLRSEIVVGGETKENVTNPAKLAFAFAWKVTNRTSNQEGQFNRMCFPDASLVQAL